MDPRDFDKLVDDCMRVVPPRFRRKLHNVLFVVEAEPPRPGLLGLYQGIPLNQRSVSYAPPGPDRITIYQGPHERLARDEADLRRLVRETIWHEVAHYFGMNEAEVQRAERMRARQEAKRRRL